MEPKKSLTFQELTEDFNKLVPGCAVLETYGYGNPKSFAISINVLKILTQADYVVAFGKQDVSNLDTLRLIKDVDKETSKITCTRYVLEVQPYDSCHHYIRISDRKESYGIRDRSMLTRSSTGLAKRLIARIKTIASGEVVDNILEIERAKARTKRIAEYSKLFNVHKENVSSYYEGSVDVEIPLSKINPDIHLKISIDTKKNEYTIEGAPRMTKEQLDGIREILKRD